MATRDEWAAAFCLGIGAPATKANRQAIVSWIQAEGGTAKWNPLNSTLKVDGSWDYNKVPVQNYPSYVKGLGASVATLLDGAEMVGDPYGYRPILFNLKSNRGSIRVLRAVERSQWGTGGLALLCLYWVKRYWTSYKSKPING